MEGKELEKKTGDQITSAASFVEGGIQEAYDDACSICLEEFSNSDPSTITNCRHEFHLHCILEWGQRSSQCPMCWQTISMKDAVSRELFQAVEEERNFRSNQARNAAMYHRRNLGHFDLQHSPGDDNEVDIEEQIFQRLAAATGVRRAHHMPMRESLRTRSSLLGRSQFIVVSAPSVPPNSSISSSIHAGDHTEPTPPAAAIASVPLTNPRDARAQSISPPIVQTDQNSPTAGSSASWTNARFLLQNRIAAGQSSPAIGDSAGPSDLRSFSDSMKSRLSSMSMRYRESFSRNTRGWKEKWFSPSTSMAEIGSEVQREVNAGISTVSRMLERFESTRARHASVSDSPADWSNVEHRNQNTSES